MPSKCGPTAVTSSERHGAQLRYDSLIALVAKWNRVSSVEEAARTLVSGVKFVLSLDAWRFSLADEETYDDRPSSRGRVLIVEGDLAHTNVSVTDARSLAPLEHTLFASGAPIFFDETMIAVNDGEIPRSLRARGIRNLYGTASSGPS